METAGTAQMVQEVGAWSVGNTGQEIANQHARLR